MDRGEPQRKLWHLCVCACVHAHSSATRQAVDASQHVCVQMKCVGTLHSSGGRMLFPHPSLPIISRPDKTPVCWCLQDQTVMSRQLSSQHTADARWPSLSWVLGCMQCASGGQLIRKGNCDMIWWHSRNHNYSRQSPCGLTRALICDIKEICTCSRDFWHWFHICIFCVTEQWDPINMSTEDVSGTVSWNMSHSAPPLHTYRCTQHVCAHKHTALS